MNLEEMQLVWKQLDSRLERQELIVRMELRDRRLNRARLGLRPLFWGQVLQILFGVLVILLAVAHWTAFRYTPHQLAAGVIVHVYGVLTIILGGITLGRMSQIDYAAPVATIQKQLASLRCMYVRSGMVVGLSWWIIWVPFMMVVIGLLGADFYSNAPFAMYFGLGIGVVGLLATWIFHRWAHQPNRPRLAKWLDESVAGGSLTKARKIVDEVAQFEQE